MNILHVINSLHTGGAEKLLVSSIPLYEKKGMNVELLLLDGIETSFLNELKKKDVVIHSLNRTGFKSIYNPLNIFYIIPYLKRYDIIHVHLFPSLYWVSLAKILSFSNVNLVFTEHSTYNRRLGKGIWPLFDRIIYSSYNVIVSISKEVNEAIKSHLSFKKESAFKIISNGINLSLFSELSFLKEANSHNVIIQVSSFNSAKDQSTLIKSMIYLPLNVKLVLVGEGENKINCQNLAIKLNIVDRVLFLGLRMDIPQLLKSADIVVLSSHWEGFGLAAVEGMAAGKPVVASEVPGLRDVVHGAGLLFRVGDEKELAEKLNVLLENPNLYQEVAVKCLNRSKEYDINKMVDQYKQLYKELLTK